MSDRMILRLNEEWAVFADNQQWIVSKARKLRSECKWHPQAYIGSKKAVLLRYARENGIQIDPKALATIEAWPDRFLTWRDLAQVRAA